MVRTMNRARTAVRWTGRGQIASATVWVLVSVVPIVKLPIRASLAPAIKSAKTMGLLKARRENAAANAMTQGIRAIIVRQTDHVVQLRTVRSARMAAR